MTYQDAVALVEKHGGNQSAAAREANVSRQYLNQILLRGDRPLQKSGRKKSGDFSSRVYTPRTMTTNIIAQIAAGNMEDGRYRSIGHRMLCSLAEQRGLSSNTIARDLGISCAAINALRLGKVAFPSLPVAVGLNKLLGIPYESWLQK